MGNVKVKAELFLNKFSRVFYVEQGREVFQKGVIVDIDSDFVYLKTHKNTHAIKLKDVIKIRAEDNGGEQ